MLLQGLNKAVFKGMQTMAKALVQGLEITYHNQGVGGMASAFMLMEILHTHFWEKDNFSSGKSDASNHSLVSFGTPSELMPPLKHALIIWLSTCRQARHSAAESLSRHWPQTA